MYELIATHVLKTDFSYHKQKRKIVIRVQGRLMECEGRNADGLQEQAKPGNLGILLCSLHAFVSISVLHGLSAAARLPLLLSPCSRYCLPPPALPCKLCFCSCKMKKLDVMFCKLPLALKLDGILSIRSPMW